MINLGMINLGIISVQERVTTSTSFASKTEKK